MKYKDYKAAAVRMPHRLVERVVLLALLCVSAACTPHTRSSEQRQRDSQNPTPSPQAVNSPLVFNRQSAETNTANERQREPNSSIRAESLTGTYELDEANEQRKNLIKVLALGGNRLKVKFEGLWEYSYEGEPIANVGEAEGEVTLEGDTAVLQPEGSSPCRIILRFVENRISVMQESDCGFGQHVNANGQYMRRSRRRPEFDEVR